MGMKKLDQILGIFEEHRGPSETAAMIQNGSLPTEKRVVGKVTEITEKVNYTGLTFPVIIVVGSTAKRLLPMSEKSNAD